MARFMILYNSTESASETMANATEEQMKASMADWMTWKTEAEKSFKVEFGLPLQAVGKVDSSGSAESTTMVSGYSIAEGDSKESLLDLLKNHPHLKRPGAFIEVLEMLSMPGM